MQKRHVKVWVTKTNHVWASEATGLPLEEIKRRYEEAHAKKVVCTITGTFFGDYEEDYANQYGVLRSTWEEYRDSERQKSRRTIPFEDWRDEGPQGEIRV